MPGDYLDETHQRIVEFADEFLEDDEERTGFIDGLMERRGYQRTSSWAPPESQQGGQGQRPGLLKQGGRGGQGGGQRPARGGQGGSGGYFKAR